MRCTRNTLSNFRLSPFCLLSRSCQLQSTPSQQQSFTSRWPHCGRLLHDQQHRAAASFRMHSSRAHQVFLAFGSNLGNRLDNIHRALEELEHPPSPSTAAEPVVHILDTSFLYESLPMYYQDQGRFLNGVVKVSPGLHLDQTLLLLLLCSRTPGVADCLSVGQYQFGPNPTVATCEARRARPRSTEDHQQRTPGSGLGHLAVRPPKDPRHSA